jgi:hypothetical protein
VDKEFMRRDRLALYSVPDYKPRKNKANNYGFDANEQMRRTYTGMGEDINVHDQWAVESLGPIQDRVQEHLGTADKAIIANRRLLIKAIDDAAAGIDPIMTVAKTNAAEFRGPVSIDTVASVENWRQEWRGHAAKRRAGSSWAPDAERKARADVE